MSLSWYDGSMSRIFMLFHSNRVWTLNGDSIQQRTIHFFLLMFEICSLILVLNYRSSYICFTVMANDFINHVLANHRIQTILTRNKVYWSYVEAIFTRYWSKIFRHRADIWDTKIFFFCGVIENVFIF